MAYDRIILTASIIVITKIVNARCHTDSDIKDNLTHPAVRIFGLHITFQKNIGIDTRNRL